MNEFVILIHKNGIHSDKNRYEGSYFKLFLSELRTIFTSCRARENESY
jgi:hypothetical protein